MSEEPTWDDYLKTYLEPIKDKLTWLSNENATLHTQVDNDALKRAELEQRLLTFEALYTDIDHKRLGALEKKYELNKENIPKTIHKYYNKNKEKIAELRNQIQNNSIADLNHYTELKEKLDGEKCEYCGRELIYYTNKWICGHGCKKPAVQPDLEAGSARQTVFCPICGNEITKIEHVVFHDFKVIVAREDLKKIQSINNDYIFSPNDKQSKINWFLNKYLKEEEDE